MSTIGITVPVGSPTALALAIELLQNVQSQQEIIAGELGQAVSQNITVCGETTAEGIREAIAGQISQTMLAPSLTSRIDETNAEVTLDKRGLPWDARINSDAKERLNTKGEWKRRKNISDELVAQVEAELRAGLAVGATDTPAPQAEAPTTVVETPPAPPAPPAPAAPEPVKILQAVGSIDLAAYRNAGWTDEQLVANGHAEWVEQAPAAPAPPTPPAPPAPPAAPAATADADPTDWNGVASWVTKLQAKGVTLTPPELDSTAKGLGLSMLPELANRPDLIPQFVAAIKQLKGL